MRALGFGLGVGVGRGGARAPLPPVFDFTDGTLPPGATLTRGSPGTRWTASGRLATEPAHVARFDHDPVSHAPRGLLLEPAATNLVPWSQRLDRFGERSECSVAPDTLLAPDGSMTMDRLSPTAGTSVLPYIADAGAVIDPAEVYTLSVFARAGTLRWAAASGDVFDNQRIAWFDLAERQIGTIGDYVSGAGITPVGATTSRIAVSFTGTASAYGLLSPQLADGAGGGVFAADSALGMWGAMLERGAAASSYVATDGTAAVRAADALRLDWAMRGLADGPIMLRYTFDDGSSQDQAATVSGGTTAVPTDLARRWLQRVERV